ncbi:PREDICTED: early nodulin-like protein 3 [Tarenaya hassleriana]|uniref:early nodulin-like protein 3 n=1 Tax=Tarenaya hassleriana TaxID=28532 RepID=UPI00053C84E5|nr:PREDICTED: early nodulin-like protein 3 [Tarenaya hassleriana]
MARVQQKNTICGFGLLCLFVIVQRACAREFMVGGSKGWTVPSDSQMFNQWAEHNRFQIGDSLMFVYSPNQDSVLQVTKDDYNACNPNSPIAKFTDGHTSFAFNNSGPYYFISGSKENCQKNEKILVIVMADRTKSTPVSPSPSPSTPGTAPSGAIEPSPPAPGTVEITPTPPPTPESPKNAAASSFSGPYSLFLTSIGSLLGVAMVSSAVVPF